MQETDSVGRMVMKKDGKFRNCKADKRTDCGVTGAYTLIGDYLRTRNRNITERKKIFLTHSSGLYGAAELWRRLNCEIYAAG